VNPPDRETTEAARLLLPPEFATEGPTEALTASATVTIMETPGKDVPKRQHVR